MAEGIMRLRQEALPRHREAAAEHLKAVVAAEDRFIIYVCG
jgi:hypothetical protein